ncbi:MAG: EAL domain-containing protein [Proteobacteria bacterium]|nr:EAL domain-containing protein [Pseudomonadota bacterium]
MSRRRTFLSYLVKPQVTSIGIFFLVCGLYLVGALEFLDFQIFDAQFRLNKRPASQSIIIVEIDSRSLKQLDVWPWPRSYYAKAIDKISQAGAKSIVVDIDFSSPSKKSEDTLLQKSLQDSKADLYLPVFQQFLDSRTDNRQIDTTPHSDFLPFVKVASSNYLPESDGLIRVQDIYHHYGNKQIPTFSASITENISLPSESFFIDYGIQPDSIPRVSFSDLIQDKYKTTIFNGKKVILGATAIELGDIKSTPVFRTLAGPVIIALSYETIIQNRMLQLVPLVLSLPLLLAICLSAAILFNRLSWKLSSLTWIGISILLYLAANFTQGISSWLLEISPMIIAITLIFLLSILRQSEIQSLQLLLQSIELTRSDILMRAVVENSFTGIVITDNRGVIIRTNPSTQGIFGYEKGKMIGKHIASLFAKASMIEISKDFPKKLRKENEIKELYGIRSDGVEFDLETIVCHVVTEESQNFALFFRDITFQKEQARLLEHQAYYDFLTNLPNRLLLGDRIKSAIKSAYRNGKNFAMLLIDLDHFKEVNDTLGHAVGDKLLIHVAKRLKNTIRDSDTVSRLGGDEFAVLLLDVNSIEIAVELTKKILIDFYERFKLMDDTLPQEIDLSMEASIGVVIFPDHGESLEELLKNAEIAMYKAKREKTGYIVYDTQDDTHNIRRLILFGDLRNAVEKNELFLNYQPQITLSTGELAGFEALVRWTHNEYGFVPPNEFIDMAERSGLIHNLTGFVLETAIAQTGKWLKEGLAITMSVNLSMRNLQDESLPVLVRDLLAQYQVPVDRLILEATETAMMINPEITLKTLQTLSGMGIQISIDDFGTGHSSLSYIKDMPLHELKIDQSFVMTMLESERSLSIVKTVAALANALKLETVAEGVETIETAVELLKMGCQIAQGYYFAKPMLASEVVNWIAEQELPDSNTNEFLSFISSKNNPVWTKKKLNSVWGKK